MSETEPTPRPASTPEPSPGRGERAWIAFGPVLAGLVIDLLDLVTLGPPGILLGAVLGTPLGFWLARRSGLSVGPAIWLGVLAGVYCALPFTAPIPVATLAGAFLRFAASGRSE